MPELSLLWRGPVGFSQMGNAEPVAFRNLGPQRVILK
jgi:hypothetical protein